MDRLLKLKITGRAAEREREKERDGEGERKREKCESSGETDSVFVHLKSSFDHSRFEGRAPRASSSSLGKIFALISSHRLPGNDSSPVKGSEPTRMSRQIQTEMREHLMHCALLTVVLLTNRDGYELQAGWKRTEINQVQDLHLVWIWIRLNIFVKTFINRWSIRSKNYELKKKRKEKN